MKIGFIVGSLRKDSYNRKVAEVVYNAFPEEVEKGYIDILNVPLYNEDLDGETVHEEFQRVRDEVREYDGYLFFVPEYNRSYAPAAKNIIDIVSKDPEGNSWKKKPAAIFSASPGGYGGMGGNFALRQVFTSVNLIPFQRPEIYLSEIDKAFDENGEMVERTKKYLEKATKSFLEFAKLFQ